MTEHWYKKNSKKTRQVWTVFIPYSLTSIVIPHTIFHNELSTLNSKTGSMCKWLKKVLTEEMSQKCWGTPRKYYLSTTGANAKG